MNSNEMQALLWKLGLNQSLKQITKEHKLHLNHQKALEEKRLRLKIHEKEQLAARDALLYQVRRFYEKNGEVGLETREYRFRFLLGEHRTSGGLEVYEESRSRLHPTKNIVSLWNDQKHLETFLKHKEENDKYFKEQRRKGENDIRISHYVPHLNICDMSAFTTEIDPDKITNLIEALEERLFKQFGSLPKTTQPLVYDSMSARGQCCILEIQYK